MTTRDLGASSCIVCKCFCDITVQVDWILAENWAMFSLSSFPSFNSWQQSSFLKRAYSSGGQFNIANKFGTVNFPQIKVWPTSCEYLNLSYVAFDKS